MLAKDEPNSKVIFFTVSVRKNIDFKIVLTFFFMGHHLNLDWFLHTGTAKKITFKLGSSFYDKQSEFDLALELHTQFFAGHNGILLPKLFWPTVRKNCSSDREKILKLEAEGREFAKILRSLEQQWKVRTIFVNRILF